MTEISEVKNHLIGLGHGSTLNKVRNINHAFERASNAMLSHIDPIETIRIATLNSLVYDDVNNYSLPSDYKKIIDLIPQADRKSWDNALRKQPRGFDVKKALENRTISIEASEGTKTIRINWKHRNPILYHSMNSLTSNGTWSVFGSATGLKAQTLFKVSGNASIEFDLEASGDGIQNTGASALDLTDEDEVADVFAWVYLPSAPTSLTAIWGNDLTANYWTGVAQTTQADGTAFKTGWNLIKWPWSTATETGTVAPATIDSFRITIANGSALTNVRVDNIFFAVGKNFDLKYYSQYPFRNSAGTFIVRPTDDTDSVVYEGTALQIFLMESLKAMAQQIEGEDAVSDMRYASQELNGDFNSPDRIQRIGLYGKYRTEYPTNAKKAVTTWSNPRNPNLRS